MSNFLNGKLTLPLSEVAEIFGKSEWTIKRWACLGKIPACKVPDTKSWIFIKDDIINHIKKYRNGYH